MPALVQQEWGAGRNATMPRGEIRGEYIQGLNRGEYIQGLKRGEYIDGLDRAEDIQGLNRGEYIHGLNRGEYIQGEYIRGVRLVLQELIESAPAERAGLSAG